MITKYMYDKKEDILNKCRSKKGNSMLIFSSNSCPPCRMLSRMLDTYQSDRNVDVLTVKIDQIDDLDYFRDTYKIEALPTIVIVDEGLNVKEYVKGFKEERIIEIINKHF